MVIIARNAKFTGHQDEMFARFGLKMAKKKFSYQPPFWQPSFA